MTQCINKQIGALPAIESKLHLFEVGREMLCAEPVPCSHDAALEKREGGFNRIGVNVAQHRFIGLRHCVPDAMAEIPRRLVAHSDRALNLAGRHTLLRLAEQVRGQKPLAKRKMGVIKHGAGSDGKLVVTVLAVEEMFFGFEQCDWPLATQAARPLGEAETDKQFTALILGTEQSVYIN